MKVAIAGGSGLIGNRLTQILQQNNIDVVHLSRKKNNINTPVFLWDVNRNFIEKDALKNVDAIVNLAGAGIVSKAWSNVYQQEIVNSRIKAAQTIAYHLKNTTHQVSTYIGASAIGYYGNCQQKNITENTVVTQSDFLSTCCNVWEQSHNTVCEEAQIRSIVIRIGIVLSTKGGALAEMLKSFKFYTGFYFGNGQMQTSWIHIDDLCNAIMFSLQNKNIHGVYNCVAIQPVCNKGFIQTIGNLKHAIFILPLPLWVLKLIMGKRLAVITQSLHVSSNKLQAAGFRFKYTTLKQALQNLFQHKN